jgi:hypothetical protein
LVTAALHGLASLGRARQAFGPFHEIAAQVDGELVVARAAHVNTIAAGDFQAVRKVSQIVEDLGAHLSAAEASFEAAAVLRRVGRPRDAAADDHKAGTLLSRCEGASTPTVNTIGARARLTSGELDAATKAAAGRSGASPEPRQFESRGFLYSL